MEGPKDHNCDKQKNLKRGIVNLMFIITRQVTSVRKISKFCNIFPAHCTTIMLPTTATTSEATHCRLSDNIPIIMESTMTTTSKSFFFCFCNGPNPIPHPPFFYYYCLCHNSIEIEKRKKALNSL